MCVCVSVCVCMCKSWKLCTFMKDTLYLDAEIEKKKSTGVKYTMLFELNFRLDLLRFHKEFPILLMGIKAVYVLKTWCIA